MSTVQVIMDWDTTLTMSDTMHTLASIGYSANVSNHKDISPWSHFVNSYSYEYELHEAEYVPNKKNRTTIDAESAWLKSLAQVEQRSFVRFCEEGPFNNVSRTEMNHGTAKACRDGHVKMRPGWDQLISLGATEIGCKLILTISSVNWSKTFIQEYLREAVYVSKFVDTRALSAVIERMAIHANEILQPNIKYGIHTSADKAEILKAERSDDNKPERVIYLGDSITDFDSLLAADLGVCIRSCGKATHGEIELSSTLKRVGVVVKPLKAARALQRETKAGKPCVWWTDDLCEVVEFIRQLL